MSERAPPTQTDASPATILVVAGLPDGYRIEVDGEAVTVSRPDGGVSEWSGRPDTNGSGMYDLCRALAALSVSAPGATPSALFADGPVGEAFVALRALWGQDGQMPSWPDVEPLVASLGTVLSARSGAGGLEVRRLDWRFRHERSPCKDDIVADSPFGQYVIRPRNGAGAGAVGLWIPDSGYRDAVTFDDVRAAQAAALSDLVSRVRSCFAAPQAVCQPVPAAAVDAGVRPQDAYVAAHHERVPAERAASHAADEDESALLDLADAHRELETANSVVALASALVSHGDAAGFDASVFEGCSPGFRKDFHALRRAIASLPSASTAAPPVPTATIGALERRIEAMDDYVTHHGDWRRACEIARDSAGPSGPDHNDRGYWEHQLKTLDRLGAALGIERNRAAVHGRSGRAQA